MKRYLIIDDLRTPSMLLQGLISEKGGESYSIEVARNYDVGYALLSKSMVEGAYDVLLLDHDLGGKKSGYDLLRNILSECHYSDGKLIHRFFGNLPKVIKCVSDNPPGRKNINSLIQTIYGMRQQ